MEFSPSSRYLSLSLWDPSLSKAVCDSIFLSGSPRLGSPVFWWKVWIFLVGTAVLQRFWQKGSVFWKWVLVLEVWDIRFVEGFGGKWSDFLSGKIWVVCFLHFFLLYMFFPRIHVWVVTKLSRRIHVFSPGIHVFTMETAISLNSSLSRLLLYPTFILPLYSDCFRSSLSDLRGFVGNNPAY